MTKYKVLATNGCEYEIDHVYDDLKVGDTVHIRNPFYSRFFGFVSPAPEMLVIHVKSILA